MNSMADDTEILKQLHKLPTEKQFEIFFMLNQTKNNVYEILSDNLGNVVLSNVMKHQDIELINGQLTAKFGQGYRTVFGTHGITSGTYYYECCYEWPDNVSQADKQCHRQFHPQVRIGFSTYESTLDGPVGFDDNSVAIRSVDGTICMNRKRLETNEEYGTQLIKKNQINPKSIIGCLIHIPEDFEPDNPMPEEQELCLDKHTYIPLQHRLRTQYNQPVLKQELNQQIDDLQFNQSNQLNNFNNSNINLSSLSKQTTFQQQDVQNGQLQNESVKIELETSVSTHQSVNIKQNVSQIQDSQSKDKLLSGSKKSTDTFPKSKQNHSQIIPGSYIEFYIDNVLVARKNRISYSRWYPAISGYNYAKVSVNFGAKNIKIPGYPKTFYCLSGCLIDPFGHNTDFCNKKNSDSNEYSGQQTQCLQHQTHTSQKYQYGCVPLDINRITEEDNQTNFQTNIQTLLSKQQIHQQSVLNFDQISEQLNSSTFLAKEDRSTSVPYTDSMVTQSPVPSLTSPNKISYSYQYITDNDLCRTQMNIQDFKNFLRRAHYILTSENKPNKNVKQEVKTPKNKGFIYLPPKDATPFSTLYLQRSRREYKSTDQALNDGIYNKQFHMLMECIYGEKSRKVKR